MGALFDTVSAAVAPKGMPKPSDWPSSGYAPDAIPGEFAREPSRADLRPRGPGDVSIDAPATQQAPAGGGLYDTIASAVQSAPSVSAPTSGEGEKFSPLGTDSENFWAAAGKSVVDLGRGTKQLMDIPAKALEKAFPGVSRWAESHMGTPSAANSSAATDADVTKAKTTDAPLMDTKAGMGGSIVGTVATTMMPLGAIAKTGNVAAKALFNPTTYKAATASGAVQGALRPVTKDESRVGNIAVGALAGGAGNAAINTVGRIAQPITKVMSAAHDKAVEILQSAGIPLDAAQRTGSTFLNKVRSSFSDNPFTAGAQGELAAEQKARFNRAVMKTIGEDAPAATPEVMGAAEQRINGVFKDILDRNSIAVNDSVLSRIGEIQKSANEEEKKAVSSIANRLIASVENDGTIPGQVAYGIKKDLDRLASSSDSTLAYHARQMRSTVMDAINGSLDGADRAAFSEARGQFANMKKIESAIDRSGTGDVSAPKLANVFAQKSNRAISIYGKGPQELFDLAQAGNMLLPDKSPNSGTAARVAMQIGLPLLAGSAEGYRAHSAGDDAMGHALATIGAVAAGPKAAQFLINNPTTAAYLSKGIHGDMTPLRDLLLLGNKNAVVGGSMRKAIPAAVQQRDK